MQLCLFVNDFIPLLISLIQMWVVVGYPKSLWGIESEINSSHLSHFTLIKIMSPCCHHVSILVEVFYYDK